MEDRRNSPVQLLKSKSSKQNKLAERRALLKLGAAGLPMMLTLKASAQSVAVSQLSCFFRLPARVRVMVNSDGDAWSSTSHNVRFNRRRQVWRKDDLEEFLLPQNSIHFTGGVPSVYRPSTCNTPPQGNWVYCGWNKFTIGNSAKITPANFINNSGDFEFDGSDKALYVALSLQYSTHSTSGWPGISCIVSILTYLDLQ